jgi:hypothetical protein
MAAYAVMARIGRVDPHLALHDVKRDAGRDEPPAGLSTSDANDDAAAIEIDRASEPGPLAERLTRLHELWRQTTFYLFDADSWRT